jgi:hypothetical protein
MDFQLVMVVAKLMFCEGGNIWDEEKQGDFLINFGTNLPLPISDLGGEYWEWRRQSAENC